MHYSATIRMSDGALRAVHFNFPAGAPRFEESALGQDPSVRPIESVQVAAGERLVSVLRTDGTAVQGVRFVRQGGRLVLALPEDERLSDTAQPGQEDQSVAHVLAPEAAQVLLPAPTAGTVVAQSEPPLPDAPATLSGAPTAAAPHTAASWGAAAWVLAGSTAAWLLGQRTVQASEPDLSPIAAPQPPVWTPEPAPAPAGAEETYRVRVQVFLGPVSGGMRVEARSLEGVLMGQAETVQTEPVAGGGVRHVYELRLPVSYRGPLLVVAHDTNDAGPQGPEGNYLEEVQGTSADVRSVAGLRALLVGSPDQRTQDGVVDLVVTPLTELAARMAGWPGTGTPGVPTEAQTQQYLLVAQGLARALGIEGSLGLQTVPQIAGPDVPVTPSGDAAQSGLALTLLAALETSALTRAGTVEAVPELDTAFREHLLDDLLETLAAGTTLRADGSWGVTADASGRKSLALLAMGADALESARTGHANGPGIEALVQSFLRDLTPESGLPPPEAPSVEAARYRADGTVEVRVRTEPGALVTIALPDGTSAAGRADSLGRYALVSDHAQPEGVVVARARGILGADSGPSDALPVAGEALQVPDPIPAPAPSGPINQIPVQEAGSVDTGIIDVATRADPLTLTARGLLLAQDPEKEPVVWRALEPEAGSVPEGVVFSFSEQGSWSVTVDPDAPEVVALGAGAVRTLVWPVQASDGQGGVLNASVRVALHGVNDAATISVPTAGADTGIWDAATGEAATGKLAVTDPDQGDDRFMAGEVERTGSTDLWGRLAIQEDGTWTYVGRDDSDPVRALNPGETASEQFEVFSLDYSASQTITVTVAGKDDLSQVTGDLYGQSVAQRDVLEKPAVQPPPSGLEQGTVRTVDPDPKDSALLMQARTGQGPIDEEGRPAAPGPISPEFQAFLEQRALATGGSVPVRPAGYGGTLDIDANGNWTYLRDDSNLALRALRAGEEARESFEVKAADGSAERIEVTITGVNDTPQLIRSKPQFETDEDTPVPLSGSGLIGLDPDAGNQLVTVGLAVEHGSLRSDGLGTSGVALTRVDEGRIVLQGTQTQLNAYSAEGKLFYVPETDWHGTSVLRMSVNDGGNAVGPEGAELSEAERAARAREATETVPLVVRPVDDAPRIEPVEANHAGTVREAGTVAGTAQVSGQIQARDPEGTPLYWRLLDEQGTPLTPSGGLSRLTVANGVFELDATGGWTFLLNDDAPAVQALRAGSPPVEQSFRVLVTDRDPSEAGALAAPRAVEQVVRMTLLGADDVATVSGTLRVETEVGLLAGSTAQRALTGSVTLSDPDGAEQANPAGLTVERVGSGYGGTITLQPDGSWAYHRDDTNPALQALAATELVSEPFRIVSPDGSAAHTLTVDIYGSGTSRIGGTREAVVQEDSIGSDTTTGQVKVMGRGDVPATFETTVTPPASSPYGGGLTLNSGGDWTYTRNNALMQALGAGQLATEDFGIQADAGLTGTIRVTLQGENDVPVMVAADTLAAGQVAAPDASVAPPAADRFEATGTLKATDPDTSDALTWSLQGATNGVLSTAWGTFALEPAAGSGAGAWRFTLDPNQPATRALAAQESAQVTATFRASDGQGGHVDQLVNVQVQGGNDVATLSASAPGVDSRATTAQPLSTPLAAQTRSVTGQITVTDPDTAQAVMSTAVTAAAGNALGGSLAMRADGSWTYLRDDTNAAVQRLTQGETATETFTVQSADGSASRAITLTVEGVNDAPMGTLPAQRGVEGSPVAIVGARVEDVDAAGSTMSVTLSVGQGGGAATGVLEVAAAAGNWSTATGTRDGVAFSGGGSGAITLSGTRTALNALLARSDVLRYRTSENDNRAVDLVMTTNDGGNGNPAQAATHTARSTLTIDAVNDAPVLALNAAGTTGLWLFSSGIANPLPDVLLSDVDLAETSGGTLTARVQFAAAKFGYSHTGSRLSSTAGGSTESDGSYVITGTANEVQQGLNALTFTPLPSIAPGSDPAAVRLGAHYPVVLTTTLSDGGNTGSGGALSAPPLTTRILPSNRVANGDAHALNANHNGSNSWIFHNLNTSAANLTTGNSPLTGGGFAPEVNQEGVILLHGTQSGTGLASGAAASYLDVGQSLSLELEQGKAYRVGFDASQVPGDSAANALNLKIGVSAGYNNFVYAVPTLSTLGAGGIGAPLATGWKSYQGVFVAPQSAAGHVFSIHADSNSTRRDLWLDRLFVSEVTERDGPQIATDAVLPRQALLIQNRVPSGPETSLSFTVAQLMEGRTEVSQGAGGVAITELLLPSVDSARLWYTLDGGANWKWVSASTNSEGGSGLAGGRMLLLANNAQNRVMLEGEYKLAGMNVKDPVEPVLTLRAWDPVRASAAGKTEAISGAIVEAPQGGDVFNASAARSTGVLSGWIGAEAGTLRGTVQSEFAVQQDTGSDLARHQAVVIASPAGANPWVIGGEMRDLGLTGTRDTVPDLLMADPAADRVWQVDSATQKTALGLEESRLPGRGKPSAEDRAAGPLTVTALPVTLTPNGVDLAKVRLGSGVGWADADSNRTPDAFITLLGSGAGTTDDSGARVGAFNPDGTFLGGVRITGAGAGGLASYGAGPASTGDMDGDGRREMLVIAAPLDGAGAGSPQAFVASGQGIQAAAATGLAVSLTGNATPGGWAARLTGTVHHAALVGDINADGMTDLVYAPDGGNARLILGNKAIFGRTTDANQLNRLWADGQDLGLAVRAESLSAEATVMPIQGGGDFNGDARSDVILRTGDQSVRVLFGNENITAANLQGMGSSGFTVQAPAGWKISSARSAGDFNGDGFDELVVGAANANGDRGAAFVLFGKANLSGATFDLARLTPAEGLAFQGRTGERLGADGAGVGDINGDGLDDILISSGGAAGRTTGQSYLLYGDLRTAVEGVAAPRMGTAGADQLSWGIPPTVHNAGQGNDYMTVSGAWYSWLEGFRKVDGGAGIDELASNGSDLNFTSTQALGKFESIERLVVNSPGQNMIRLSPEAVLAMTEGDGLLKYRFNHTSNNNYFLDLVASGPTVQPGGADIAGPGINYNGHPGTGNGGIARNPGVPDSWYSPGHGQNSSITYTYYDFAGAATNIQVYLEPLSLQHGTTVI